jgi:hypothetical protein
MQANRSESTRLLRRCRGLGRLIGAVTKPGDLVVDPAAGGLIVLRAPMALGLFIGFDIAHHREDQTAA